MEASTYLPLLELLRQHNHVIAMDLPGFGKSDFPEQPWHANDYSRWFQAFIKHKKIRNATLIAHSYGCAIALAIGKNSAIINQILTAPVKPTAKFIALNYILTGMIKTFHEMKLYRHTPAFKRFMKTAVKNIARYLRHPRRYYKHIHFVYSTIPNATHVNTCVIIGSTDELVRYAQAKQILNASHAVQVMEIEGNHDFPIFEPQGVMKALSIVSSI